MGSTRLYSKFCTMVVSLSNGLFFGEFLGDSTGGGAFDGDGITNKADDFIEVHSLAGNTVSLDGIEPWSAKRGQPIAFSTGNIVTSNGPATISVSTTAQSRLAASTSDCRTTI